jgi:hypothetical protein
LASEPVHVDDQCNRHGDAIREREGRNDSADLAPRDHLSDHVAEFDCVANIRWRHCVFSSVGCKGQGARHKCDGAGVDIAMKAGLKKHGLIDKRDYTVIETPFPTMPSILNEKKADHGMVEEIITIWHRTSFAIFAADA